MLRKGISLRPRCELLSRAEVQRRELEKGGPMATAPCPQCRKPLASDRPLEIVTCGYHLCRQDLHLACAVKCHREPKCVRLFCVEHREEHWCGVTEPDHPEEATLSGVEGGISADVVTKPNRPAKETLPDRKGRGRGEGKPMEVDETTSSASSSEEGGYRRNRVRSYDPTSGADRNSPYAHSLEEKDEDSLMIRRQGRIPTRLMLMRCG